MDIGLKSASKLLCALLICIATLSSAVAQTISFTNSTLAGDGTLHEPTSLQFGPDGRLYVAERYGKIYAYTILRNSANNYQIVGTETITSIQQIQNHNDDGTPNNAVTGRQVTGLVVTGTAANPVIFVTSSDPREGGGNGTAADKDKNLDTNSGMISKLTWNGTSWARVDLVRGLPRSEENHSPNGLAYDKVNNVLYMAQGGNTNMGAPSNNFAYLPEYAYSTAILKIDLNAITTPPYDLPTLDDETRTNVSGQDVNDPFGGNDGLNQAVLVAGGPVTVYSPGWRNNFDICIMQTAAYAGKMYSFDNGSNGGWGGIPIGCTIATNEGGSNHPDGLHYVTGPGYFAGFPNPVRANRSITFNASNPQSPVPPGMENPAECNYIAPGANGSLTTVSGSSTNGLCEYTASNFGGTMKGQLLAASFNGKLYRYKLNAAGNGVIGGNITLAQNFGFTPLDVVAQGDNDVFPGTIWVTLHGSHDIAVFEPNDFASCAGDANSMTLDDDADGYSNGDETQNGTDKCNPSSKPDDFDGDKLSNMLDPDDDNDGIADNVDKFAQDPANGTTTTIPMLHTYQNSNEGGIGGWGFTGLMCNNTDDYQALYDMDNMTVGGAAYKFTVDNVPTGDALGTANNQKYAYQLGVNVGAFPFGYVVHGRVMTPFGGITASNNRSMGLYLGTGDQDNYLKIVCAANSGAGGIEIVKEENGVATSTMHPAAILGSTHVNFYLDVNPTTHMVQPAYSIGGGTKTSLGPQIAIPASWTSGVMAVGFIATSRGSTPFSATWDYIAIEPIEGVGNWVNVNTVNTCTARHESAFVECGNRFYVLGGRLTKPVESYDYVNKNWTTHVAPPIQLHHFQAVTINGLIYVVGAFTGTFPNETPVPNVYIYDPIANLWHVGMEIPAARRRGSAGAVVHNGKIYLVSGLTNGHVSGWVPWVDVFDPQKNTWQTLPDIPHMRDHFQVALHGDFIYAIGGRNSGRNGTYGYTIPETDVYDISEQVWTSLPSPEGDIPTQRAACALAVLGDEILAIGGESMAHNSAHKQTEALDVNTKSWRTLDDLNTGRHGTQAIVNNYGVYIAAGCGNRGGSPELNTVEAFYLYGQTNPTGIPVSKGAISLSSTNMNFGNVHLGNSSTQKLYITNPNGNQALLIKALSLTTGADNFSFATNYTMPIVVNVGDTLALDVTFTPTSTGTKTGNLKVSSSTGVVNNTIALTGVAVGQQTTMRINSGGAAYTTAASEAYIADTYYTNFAGSTSTTTQGISGTTEDALYQTERYGHAFGYKVPVQNGSYTVKLHFAEIWAGASNAGVRVFDVSIENALVIDDLDLYTAAGMYTAYVRTFNVTVNDGELNIDLLSSVNNAKINAIEIIAPTNTQGILTAVPSTVNFPTTDVNVASTPIAVSLTNTGGASLNINSVTISGTNASNFIHNFSSPVTVAVGSTTTINVTFTPSSSGAKTATMTLNHTGNNTPLTIALSGTGGSNANACGYFVEQNGLLVVEIENSPATEGWTSETAYANYTGTEYYTWTGPNYFNEKGHGMLTYNFKINNPGRYRFKMRTQNGGPLNTHNNDVWVRFSDHGCVFVKSGQVVEEKSGWWKQWQNNLNVWTYNTWAGESTFWEVYVDFPFAGVYTMDISGRAQLYSLDRFVFYRPDMIGDWAATAANPPQSAWENCPSTPLVWYRDADLDYYGSPDDSVISVSKPGVGYVWNKQDCDDGQKTVYPGAPELLDGRDNDCDGTIDEGAYLSSLAINCGGSAYTTINGDIFESDRLYSLPSGAKFHSGVGDITNTDDDNLFKSERNTTISDNLSYNFKAKPGLYTVTLYFVEQATVMNAGERVMDVLVEDSVILNNFDIIATAGYKNAYSYTYNLRLMDSTLNVKLVDVVGKAKINALKVALKPNTPPNFTISGNSTFNEDFAGTNTLNITPAAVPSNETWQTVTYSIAPASVAFANVSINPATGQVSISAVPNMSGQQQFTVTANDGYPTTNIATKTFTLKVLAVNDAPAFTVSGNITEDEDFAGTKTVTVTPAAVPADEAAQTVTYSLSPATVAFATVSFNTTTGQVSVTSLPEQAGTQVFTITANDGQTVNNTATQTFTLTINQKNDAPTLDAISDVSINEDAGVQTVNLSGISAGPGETQTLTITAVSDNPSLIPNPTVSYTSANATGSLSFTPAMNQAGVAHITVTVNDGGMTVDKTFTVTVTAVNDAPAFTLSGNISVNEDFTTTEHVTVTPATVAPDEVGQTVTYSLSPASVSFANVSINSSTGEVTITGIPNAAGTQVFTVTANDGQSSNNTATQTFTLIVSAVNDAPVFTLSGNVTVTEDFVTAQHVTVTPGAVAPDETSQTVTYSLSPASVSFANVSINSATGEVTITAIANGAGTQVFTVTANDGQSSNNTHTQTFTLTVTGENDAPVFTLSGNVTVNEDFVAPQQVTVNPATVPADEVSQTVTYTLSPSSISFADVSINSATGEVTITSIPNVAGTQVFTVTANDGQSSNNTHSQTFTLTVNGSNDAPVFTLSGDVTVDEDFTTTEHVTVSPGYVPSDETSQNVTYSIIPASVAFANVSINSSTGEVTITAVANATGWQMFTVTANDGQSSNNTHAETFTLTVNSVNDAPVFTLSGDVSVQENQFTQETVTVTVAPVPSNEQAQTVTYTLTPPSVSFANVSINSSNGKVTITPVTDGHGSQVFTVTANDGQSSNNTYTQTFTLNVDEGNTAPTFTINRTTITKDEDFTTTETVIVTPDPVRPYEASQVVTYTLSPASVSFANISFDSNTGNVTITAVANAAGTQQFTITADDGEATNNTHEETFTLTVNSVNDAPMFTLSGDVVLIEDFATTEHVTVTPALVPANETSQTVTYTLTPPSVAFANISFNSTTGEVTITSVANASGTQLFTVKANDGQSSNNMHQENFLLTVSPANDQPTLDPIANPAAVLEDSGIKTVNLTGITAGSNETQTLTVSVSSDNPLLFSTLTANYTSPANTGTISYEPAPNQWGSATVTVTVDDGQAANHSVSRTFVITVTAVNDEPAFTMNPASLTLTEDFAGTQTVSVVTGGVPTDEAGQVVTYTLTPPTVPFANITFNSATGAIQITAIANMNGSRTFTISANDGQMQNNTHSQTFVLTVTAVNDAPVFTVNNGITVFKNFTSTEIINVTPGPVPADEVSQNVTYALQPATVTFANVSFNTSTGSVSLTAVANMTGTQTFTITANDGQSANNLHDEQFTFTVVDTNYQPTLNAIANPAAINEDAPMQTVTMTGISAGFHESQPVTITAVSNNPTLIPNPVVNHTNPNATGTLQYTPAANQNGTAIITVTVDDGMPYNNSISHTFTVVVNAVNDEPTLDAIANPASILEDAAMQTVSLTGISAGPNEQQTLTVTASSSNTTLISTPTVIYSSPGATGTVQYTPAPDQSGTATITVTVNDGQSAQNITTRTFTVTVTPVNDAPVVTDVIKAGQEDKSMSFAAANFTDEYTDAEHDPMAKIMIVSLPAHGTLKKNQSPVHVGDEILPVDIKNMTYDPVAQYTGVDSFKWNGYDGQLYALQAATVRINIGDVNDKPFVVAHIPDITVNEDAPAMNDYVNLGNIFNDNEDGGNMTYTVVLNTDPILVQIAIGTDHTLDVSFNPNGHGNSTIAIQARDAAGLIVTDTFSVSVTSVEDAPSVFNLLTPTNNSSVGAPSAIDFSWETAVDGDGDDVEYSIFITGHNVDTTISGMAATALLFNGESLFTLDSTYRWHVVATDGDDTQTSPTFGFKISVTGINNPSVLANGVTAYPNPFTNLVTINYTLKSDARVKVRILNFLGQEVEILSNAKQAKGEQTIKWNAAEAATGVYFYELQMETKSGTGSSFTGKIIKE